MWFKQKKEQLNDGGKEYYVITQTKCNFMHIHIVLSSLMNKLK